MHGSQNVLEKLKKSFSPCPLTIKHMEQIKILICMVHKMFLEKDR